MVVVAAMEFSYTVEEVEENLLTGFWFGGGICRHGRKDGSC